VKRGRGTCRFSTVLAEYEDLRVLGRGIHPMDMNDLNDAPDETVEEGQGHDVEPHRACYGWSSCVRQFLDPSSHGRRGDRATVGESTPSSSPLNASEPGFESRPIRSAPLSH
jgi:hypothetical protein